ncbi:predicted protein [Lichtheimia corymbifera JMRC:FSU:9682]|uniref:F-box domain-containing protein n=1 Tax=Lichtheimia corymbifera JMRC:FSU:9682 TaxID=1263082 RepID=A0A068RZ48_9FUNG|nr:predicted protein [Lichtheimia corymbifera JMRC:FSU:9682]
MSKHLLSPDDHDRHTKRRKKTTTHDNKDQQPSLLEQLPYELLTTIFIHSSNAQLPLVNRTFYYALYHCPEDVKLQWLLHRDKYVMGLALERGLRYRFFNQRLLDRFDAMHGTPIRLDNKMLPPHLFAECDPQRHDLVVKLLERGASPHKPQGYPLIKSAQIGNLAMIKSLVAFGADPTAKDNMALRVCAARDNKELVNYFLSDLGVKPDSETLKACVRKDLWDMVNLLIAHGAVPDLSTINCT